MRSVARTRPTIGVPSIPARSDPDRMPAPVPSIEVDAEAFQPGPLHSPVQEFPDGEETFTPAVREKLKSYVYLLVDPRTGRPFHAGRGRDDRCFEHLRAARAHGPVALDSAAGTETAGNAAAESAAVVNGIATLERIRRIEAEGHRVRVEILRHGLSPGQAAVVAAAAHELLGLPGDPPGVGQRRTAAEVQAQLTKRAKFKRPHQVVLLRAGPTGTRASYEHVRHGWRIGRRWVDVQAAHSPRWAAVVVGDLVDSVYRLDRWDLSEPRGGDSAPGGTGARPQERYSFVGSRDAELERRYVGKSAAHYLGKVALGSVAYVWCGPQWVNTAG